MAAVSVFGYHLALRAVEVDLIEERWWHDSGAYGVDLFFVISGYLIALSVARADDLVDFCVRRVSRVFPLLLVTTAVVVAANLRLGVAVDARIWLATCLLLPGMILMPTLNPPAWSLSYEVTFYLGAALAVFGWRRNRWVLAVVLLVAAAVVVVHPRFAFFFVGVGFAAAGAGPESGAGRGSGWLLLPWGMSVLALYFSMSWAFSDSPGFIEAASWQIALLPFGCALVLSVLAFEPVIRERSGVSWLLGSWPLQYLGQVSYSFYLWQGFLMFQVWTWMRPTNGMGFALYSASAFAVLLLMSHLSYKVIEEDGRRWLLARWRRHRTS